METKLQNDIAKWLRGNGAYVIITHPGFGTRSGTPDILFLFEGAWGAVEVKRSEKAPFRPGQQHILQKLKEWCPFVYVAYPENWSIIKDELTARFF